MNKNLIIGALVFANILVVLYAFSLKSSADEKTQIAIEMRMEAETARAIAEEQTRLAGEQLQRAQEATEIALVKEMVARQEVEEALEKARN